MNNWIEVTQEEFATIFTFSDYRYSSSDGYTDFYEVDIPLNDTFKGAIKEIDKVNHYYFITK